MQLNWCDSINNYEQVQWKKTTTKDLAHSDSKKPSAVKMHANLGNINMWKKLSYLRMNKIRWTIHSVTAIQLYQAELKLM